MTIEGVCENKSTIVGCAVDVSSEYGCTECLSGYYAKDRRCLSCSSKSDQCAVCDREACTGCVSDHVLKGEDCLPFSNITHCTAASNSRCTKCSFWHAPTSDGTACETHAVWWVILLGVLFCVIVFVLVVVVCIVVTQAILRKRRREEQRMTTCIFKMDRSNVSFVSTRQKGVVVNKREIVFDQEAIPVGVESKELLCVGNKGKRDMKVQFIGKEGNETFTIRTNPTVITLEKGDACEFEINVTPLCSTKIDDKALLVVKQRGVRETANIPIGLKAETELTTKLYYDDIVCETQIGEGSFGVVFKGRFRDNVVAVKKMKEVGASEEAMEEFAKEVAMLAKFRCEQIVHFYGACTIRNHIMMVTEFAPCGSLMDCIKKRPEPEERVKVKVMLDAAKGLAYLHENGILHRDVKPDNVLVFSLDEEIDVNGKLTDFGSSRNINLLMTNMTFTKGIGSPTYMAPEVLDREKYKKPADVFSFAVTMFECFVWGEAYPKSLFVFPWDIVSFVTSGNRVVIPDTIPEAIRNVISACWLQTVKERMSFFTAELTSSD